MSENGSYQAGAVFAVPGGPAASGAARRLRIRHLTRFNYHGPVTESFNETRLQPLSDPLQNCVRFELQIDPAVPVRHYQDFYYNTVHFFEVHAPHERLDIVAESVVETFADRRRSPGLVPPASLYDDAGDVLPFDFLSATSYVPLAVPLRHEARQIVGDTAQDLWGDAVRLGEYVHSTIEYVAYSTKVNTRVLEVLDTRRGVCQDLAHVMLGLCRSVGIPVRYVSGYCFNPARAPGQIEASHAWVEVYLPGHGWRGYDPTHRREPDVNYVKLALGRDYADIRPVNGTFIGYGTRELVVEVQVQLDA